MEPTTEIIHLDIEEIRRDGGTQPRAKIDLQHIKHLEQQMEDGQELEPIVVFFDGESYWLADGFHRWNAHRNKEEPTIRAIIHQGTRREAVLYSVGANADHKPALPRSRADKRKAVLTLLNDPEWHNWSNREIARVCRVNEKTVRNIRNELTCIIHEEKTKQKNKQLASKLIWKEMERKKIANMTNKTLKNELKKLKLCCVDIVIL